MLEKLRNQKSMNSIRKILRKKGIHFTEPYDEFIHFEYEGVRYSLQRRTNPVRVLIERW